MTIAPTSRVHELAKSGFGKGTNELYDRARPSYPPEALSLIRKAVGPKQSVNVVEIGSGTGIFTRALLAHPKWKDSISELTAVEPSEGMRDVFTKMITDSRVSVSEGTFDNTGVQGGWADLIVIAQAFHWCSDHDAALREFARVLKPGGVTVLLWNSEDCEGVRWVAQIRETCAQYEQGDHQFLWRLWRKIFTEPSYPEFLHPPEETTLSHTILATEESVKDLACSKSYIAVQTKELQESIRDIIHEILEKGEDKVWVDKEKGIFEYPFKTLVVMLRRK